MVFSLNGEEYGINIFCVQEIIRVPLIHDIPDSGSYLRGIVNLRNRVIPVIDLKSKLGFQDKGKNEDTRLIVFDLEGALFSIIVDDVSEVLQMDDSNIEALPPELGKLKGNCLEGIGRVDDRLLLLLNVKHILD